MDHAVPSISADVNVVTALAASRFGVGPYAVAPAKRAGDARRASTWTEPEPWIVAVVLATGVAVIARHPLARMIGTEVDGATSGSPSFVAAAPGAPGPPRAPPSSAPAAPPPPAPAASAPAQPLAAAAAPVPTHRPRNPFQALVSAGATVMAPGTAGASVGTTTTPTVGTTTQAPTQSLAQTPKPAVAPAASGSTCSGTVHTVVAGDTLWRIAATAVQSSDTGRIVVAWHRLYKAN